MMTKNILSFLIATFILFSSPGVFAGEKIASLLTRLEVKLEQQHKVMTKIYKADQKSECFNLKDCKTNVVGNEVIDTYFKDDIDLALEGLSL